tara:strand:+ start:3310 stop:4026 length:717 start_codon:yes stop_codon:yes gene_type:complete
MGVPTDENTDFDMFGSSDNTTIQGAIIQGGGSASSDTTFQQLISHSTTTKFDTIYAGATITSLSQITNAAQYRGYPSSTNIQSSNFGVGNLIGHFGTTGYQTLTWQVFLDIAGYSDKTVTIGPNTTCLHGCGYTSAARRNFGQSITGSGTITVTRMADSSTNNNNQVNDDGDVQLVVSGGTIGHNGGTSNTDGNPIRTLNNTKGVYTFSQGETFSKTFSFTNMLVADGDTFQLDITEG